MLYCVVTTILMTSYPRINAESLARDYLPEPPTPTRRALPTGKLIILAILETCSMAWSNRTKFIEATASLYSSSKYYFTSKRYCFRNSWRIQWSFTKLDSLQVYFLIIMISKATLVLFLRLYYIPVISVINES